MRIVFREFGTSLGTRHLGRIAKKELDDIFDNTDDRIIFDFFGVNLVTNSFADEIFGKKIIEVGFKEFKDRTTFKNVNPFIEICIRKAIMNRIKELETCN